MYKTMNRLFEKYLTSGWLILISVIINTKSADGCFKSNTNKIGKLY